MRKWIGAAAAVLLIVLVTLVAIFHNGAARFALSSIVPLATGYKVDMHELRLESHHGALVGVHVSRNGQTVLDAKRIDIYYDPRDLLPGSKHRFGPGHVTLAEDLTGKGHTTRVVGNQPRLTVTIPLAD